MQSLSGGLCCKSRKLQGHESLAKTRSGKQSPIRTDAIALSKSPVSLTLGDQTPHILTRKSRLRPLEILIISANDFCNTIPSKSEIRRVVAAERHPARSGYQGRIRVLPRRDSRRTRANRSACAMATRSAKHAQGAKISVSKDNHQGKSSRLSVCAVFVVMPAHQYLSRQFLRNGPLTVRGDRIGPKAATSLHYYRRTEPGFDGLAGTNLRFSEQGGP